MAPKFSPLEPGRGALYFTAVHKSLGASRNGAGAPTEDGEVRLWNRSCSGFRTGPTLANTQKNAFRTCPSGRRESPIARWSASRSCASSSGGGTRGGSRLRAPLFEAPSAAPRLSAATPERSKRCSANCAARPSRSAKRPPDGAPGRRERFAFRRPRRQTAAMTAISTL